MRARLVVAVVSFVLVSTGLAWPAAWRWQSIRRFDPPANTFIADVHFDGRSGVAVNAGQQIYVSNDWGANWTAIDATAAPVDLEGTRRVLLNPGELLYTCLRSGEQRVYVAGQQHILFSQTSGRSWRALTVPATVSAGSWVIHDMDVDPANPARLMAVGGRLTASGSWEPLALHTSNYGDTWSATGTPAGFGMWKSVRYRSPGVTFACDSGGKVAMCRNDLTWQQVPALATFTATCIYSRGTHVWIGGENGEIRYSPDDGATWRSYSLGVPRSIAAIAFLSPRVGIAVCRPNLIFHTTDGARNWTQDTVSDVYRELACATVCSTRGRNFLVGGMRYNLPVVLAEEAPLELAPGTLPKPIGVPMPQPFVH
jgi:photosystem II stability/assembly factor-like uncharacterized protein